MTNDHPAATHPQSTSALSASADQIMRFARSVFAFLAVISALTVVAAFVLQRVDSDAVTWVVWARSVFYALGGAWLLGLVRAARRRADHAAFVRMRIICILAPIGIAALVISPDSGYPVWMKIEQAVFGLLLLPLGIALLSPSVAREFPKHHQPK
jgi:hypothetical protein